MYKRIENGDIISATTIRKDSKIVLIPYNHKEVIDEETDNVYYEFTTFVLTPNEYETYKLLSKTNISFNENGDEQIVLEIIREKGKVGEL